MLALHAGLALAQAPAAPSAAATGSDGNPALPILSGPLTVADAVQNGMLYSPVIRGAESDVQIAVSQVEAAEAAREPSLSATTIATAGGESGSIFGTPSSVMPQNLFAVPRGGFANQDVMVMWPLATGGRLRTLVRQAQAAKTASGADLETVKLDLALEIKTDYFQVLLAREDALIARDREAAAADRLRNDTAAAQDGRVPQLYVLRDQAEDADARQGANDAARDVDLALIMLKTTMGVDFQPALGLYPDAALTLSGTLEDAIPIIPGNAVDLALAARPEFIAAQQRLESARLGLTAAREASSPQVALEAMADGGYGHDAPGAIGGGSVGVVVGVPIFDGGLRKSERTGVSAQIVKAQAELDRERLQVIREVESAHIAVVAAQRNAAIAEAGIAAAQEDYRVETLRYESGRGTNVEVLDALAALTRARGDRAQMLYNEQVAFSQFTRALGSR